MIILHEMFDTTKSGNSGREHRKNFQTQQSHSATEILLIGLMTHISADLFQEYHRDIWRHNTPQFDSEAVSIFEDLCKFHVMVPDTVF